MYHILYTKTMRKIKAKYRGHLKEKSVYFWKAGNIKRKKAL